MRKLIFTLACATFILMFSSCVATHSGLTSNINSNATTVVLSKNNYVILGRVSEQASGVSVLGFGGSFRPLIARAKASMFNKADIKSTSCAFINEVVEVNNKSFFGIVNSKTVTVSASLIEFTE